MVSALTSPLVYKDPFCFPLENNTVVYPKATLRIRVMLMVEWIDSKYSKQIAAASTVKKVLPLELFLLLFFWDSIGHFQRQDIGLAVSLTHYNCSCVLTTSFHCRQQWADTHWQSPMKWKLLDHLCLEQFLLFLQDWSQHLQLLYNFSKLAVAIPSPMSGSLKRKESWNQKQNLEKSWNNNSSTSPNLQARTTC